MKTLNLTEIEAKTARERDTNLFKEDLCLIIGEDLKAYLPALDRGLRNTENLIPNLKMLIADLALNLHWQFDEDSQNVTVKGYNFNCVFDLHSIGLIAERWGKEPKISTKGYMYKRKPENCTRHLKFGVWFKAIKDGLVKVGDGKALKLVGFACELGKEDLPVYIGFATGLYDLKPVKDAVDLYQWPEKLKPLAPNKFFRLKKFNAFSLENENSGRYNCTNETEAFIQFYNQITKKSLKPVNPARAFCTVDATWKGSWKK